MNKDGSCWKTNVVLMLLAALCFGMAAARGAAAKIAVTDQFETAEGQALSADQKTAMAETRPADLLDPMSLIKAAEAKAAEK